MKSPASPRLQTAPSPAARRLTLTERTLASSRSTVTAAPPRTLGSCSRRSTGQDSHHAPRTRTTLPAPHHSYRVTRRAGGSRNSDLSCTLGPRHCDATNAIVGLMTAGAIAKARLGVVTAPTGERALIMDVLV